MPELSSEREGQAFFVPVCAISPSSKPNAESINVEEGPINVSDIDAHNDGLFDELKKSTNG